MAVADLDGDGRLDLVIANNRAAPTFYLNRLESTGASLRLDLVGSAQSGRDAIGAEARLTLEAPAGGRARTLTRWVEAGSGYASQSELTLHFGLGAHGRPVRLEILWPSGLEESYSGSELEAMVAAGGPSRIEEGGAAILRP